MKNIIPKPAIPHTKVFVIKKLETSYFDPTFHFHPEYQLFLVLQGKGTRFIGDNIKPFEKGDLVFTGPNLPHVWRSDNCYFDKKNNFLHMNPGAAGTSGFHQVRTMLRFVIDGDKIKDLEIIEMEKRA